MNKYETHICIKYIIKRINPPNDNQNVDHKNIFCKRYVIQSGKISRGSFNTLTQLLFIKLLKIRLYEKF